MSNATNVRFDFCVPSHPFLIYAIMLGATLLLCYASQGCFAPVFSENKKRAKFEIGVEYDAQGSVERWLLTVSESLLPLPTRLLLGLSSLICVTLASVCLVNPALPGVIWIGAASLNIVASTKWWRYAHEVSTYNLSAIMFTVQLSGCIVYLRLSYPPSVWATFVGLEFLLIGCFAAHVWLKAVIRHMSPANKRKDCAASFEFQRVAVFEFLNIALFVTTFVIA